MLKIRKVNSGDSEILLEWRNHPEVYKFALTAKPVSQEDHEKWFSKKLNDSNCFFYLGLIDGRPCGSVRYDILNESSDAEISISLAPEFWGKGIASELINISESILKNETSVQNIIATVLNENKNSMRLFEKNLYVPHLTQFKKKIT
jgi:RimJ/RimL family protein N-acetyltransferase